MNKNNLFLWLVQIKHCLETKKYPSNEFLYLELIKKEKEWKECLLSTEDGRNVYNAFIQYILYQRKNILDARPFFRVRQSEFLTKVNPFIKNKNPENLYDLRINSVFIAWSLIQLNDTIQKQKLQELFDKIIVIRNDFFIRNSPLIINTIKLIYAKYPYSYPDIQELISIASDATLAALDKFVPLTDPETQEDKYTSVLLSSIIRRINAAAVQHNRSQKIHMYPKDRKKMLDLRKMRKNGFTNEVICETMGITELEIESLLNLSSVLSLDETDEIVSKNISPEDYIEKIEIENNIYKKIENFSVLEKKILRLKGML